MFTASPVGRRGTKIQSGMTSGHHSATVAQILSGELSWDQIDQRG